LQKRLKELRGEHTASSKGSATTTDVSGFWSGKYPLWLYAFIPALLTGLFYFPVLNNHFIAWDDPEVVVNNTHIRTLDLSSVDWMLTTFHSANWMPMTWLSFALNYFVGRLNPGVYHFTNLLLHAINTALVFFICHRILTIFLLNRGEAGGFGKRIHEIPPAFITALLFGLHPLQVESVAWITERNNVLCAFFYLLAIWFYLKYISANDRKAFRFSVCWLFFVLALMSKPLAVTFPLVLLILDGWPLRRVKGNILKVIAEKIPFLIASIVDGLITIRAQSESGAFQMTENFSFLFRVLNAFRSLGFYLLKMILPMDLVPLYPFPRIFTSGYYFEDALAVSVAFLITGLCIFLWEKRPFLSAAWLYYIVTLGPVLGILQVGNQAAADRYTYLPCIGVFLLSSVGITTLTLKWRAFNFWFCIGITCLLGFLTVTQISVWKNSVGFWETIIRHYPNDSPSFAYSNLGAMYQQAGRSDDALREYDAAESALPPWPSAHDGRGMLLFDMGKKDEAIQEFKNAISMDPNYAAAHRNLAIAYQRIGMKVEAQAELQEAHRIEQEDNR
jgi:hypothetical protein